MYLGRFRLIAAVAGLTALAIVGCSDHDTALLEPATASTEPLVFGDNYGEGATYEAFLDSKVDAVLVDTSEKYQGTASLRVTVPGPNDPSGFFAGGAFTTNIVRDLTSYDAITFWAKASKTATLDVAGLGNDNTGTSLYEASWSGIALTTSWQKYVIPIPLPSRLDLEKGLFYFAEGHENNEGYELWFDEIRFESTGLVSNPRPVMSGVPLNSFVGSTVEVTGTETTFDVGGTDQTIQHMPRYFDYTSSNESVAMIVDGAIQVVGGGTATITAKLDATDVSGSVTLEASAPPSTAPPLPTVPAVDVISLLSNAYTNVTVDKWSADWDDADVNDLQIAGTDVKAYTSFVFAGIEFISETIDAANMTHFHLDVWVPDGGTFYVKLIDFGADGTFGGAPDSEHELTFNGASSPPLAIGSWVSLDIPLADFTGLASTEHLAQLTIKGDSSTAYVTNIYFHR